MKSTLLCFVLSLFSLGAMAEDPQPKDARSKAIEQSLETFSGTWEIVAASPPGSTKEAKRLVFRRDRRYAALDADGYELWDGTYDLDPTVTPKIWDHRSTEAQKTGGDALGIYEVVGDKLKVCCVVGVWKEKQWTGKPRPTEFKLPEADVVLELRRVKAAD
jgi:uncharacterized protein (TIGR03067 family)